MKRFTQEWLILIGAALVVGLAFPGITGALEYTESSGGLEFPAWESGRTEFEMVDVNLDGNIDLITIGDHGSPFIGTQEHGIAVYFGDGRGGWSVYQNGNFGYGGIAVGDVNGDGFPDAGYAMHHNYSGTDFGDQLIEVALGDGTGQNWIPWDDGLATQGETYGMFATDFGDVDNDGDLDIAATSFGAGNPLMVYLNDGDGTWTHSQAVTPGPNNGMHVVFGDINRDGNLDIATAYQSGTVFFGDGTGQFTNADYNLPPGSGYYNRNGVALGDVDNDGGMDLAWVANSSLYVWCFDETTNSWVDFSGNLPVSGVGGYAQLWDMNSDGFCDVMVGGGGQIRVWTGDGAGNWTPAATVPIGTLQAFRVGGDVDHNGYADMVYEGDGGPHCFKETSVAQILSIMPYYPRGGEVFKSGSERFLDWISSAPGLTVSNVTVELSTTGSGGPWTVIGEGLPNNGRMQWTVADIATSTDCYLRYTVHQGTVSATTITPAPFTILGTSSPALSITLDPVSPPIQIPPGGGSFDYNVTLANSETIPQTCDAWIMVQLPNGNWYGPVLGPVSLTIPAGASIMRLRSQTVPASAPAGTYLYEGRVGDYPNVILDTGSFTFEKLASGDGEKWTERWLNTGESFDVPAQSTSQQTPLPSSCTLYPCYPNPFNPTTTLSFTLPEAAPANLSVYDVSGRLVAILVDGWREPGTHEATFDGSNLASGIYLYSLKAGEFHSYGKMVLMK